jgi:hypothetical protein
VNRKKTITQQRLLAVYKAQGSKNLPLDMRQHWGRVAKQLGPYYPLGDTFKSWLPTKKKKKR